VVDLKYAHYFDANTLPPHRAFPDIAKASTRNLLANFLQSSESKTLRM
jgi:hypothetical protein